MRIGIDARFYGSLGKGLGRYTEKLIKYLERLDDGNEYVVFLRRENFEEYRPSAPRFRKELADYRWYSFEEQLLFPRLLRRHRFDLVHFPHFNIPVLYRGRFVVTIHDLILVRFPTLRATTLHPLWYRVKFAAYKLAIRRAVFGSRKILTVSEFTRRDLLDRYPVDPEKIAVAHEAAEPFCHFQPPEEAYALFDRLGLTVRVEQASPDESSHGIIRPYLLYVGNAYPHKNLESLVEALRRSDIPDMLLVLVGKEDYFYRRLRLAVEGKGMENVRFAGFVPDRELDSLYRRARAYVFPSLYEGFGLPPLEAMGKGTPVLASRTTSLPEVLGDAALYFDPSVEGSLEDALRRMWTDAGLGADLRKKGYRRWSRFSWEEMAKKTLETYEEAFRGP
jgi:glycosyltransferase involved in cell wall biosynthesis